jgi:hypothetical protein
VQDPEFGISCQVVPILSFPPLKGQALSCQIMVNSNIKLREIVRVHLVQTENTADDAIDIQESSAQ